MINQVPHSTEVEQSVIGALLIDPQSDNAQKIFSSLSPNDFYSRHHKIIFEEMREMYVNHKPVDGLTVSESLRSKGLENETGGLGYLAEVAKSTPSVANAIGYSRKLKELSSERYALEKINEIQQIFMTPSTLSFNDKIETAQKLMAQVEENSRTGKKTGLKQIGLVVDSLLDKLEARFDDPEKYAGMKTGFRDFDALLAPKGVVTGSLFVIGARPKMGKTTVLTELAKNVSSSGSPVLLFSMEMTDEQLVERMVSQKSGVNTDTLYGGTNDDYEWSLISKAIGEIKSQDNIYVDDTPAMNFAHIQSQCRKMKRKLGKIGFIGVDYLTLMTADKADRNDLAYGDITKRLKVLAKELGTVVVLLTQLNRKLEDRPNKRPLPSDSRDTSQIEQDCDYWLGIYRDSVYNEDADNTLTELILRLNRHGKTGTTYIDQKGLCLFDTDQASAESRAEKGKTKRYAKKDF